MQGRSRCAGASKAAVQCARTPSAGTAVCQGPYCNVLVRWLETASRDCSAVQCASARPPTGRRIGFACSGPAQCASDLRPLRRQTEPAFAGVHGLSGANGLCAVAAACVLQPPTRAPLCFHAEVLVCWRATRLAQCAGPSALDSNVPRPSA